MLSFLLGEKPGCPRSAFFSIWPDFCTKECRGKYESQIKDGELTGHNATISAVTFSPDSQTIATGSEDNTARFWRAEADASIENWEIAADEVNTSISCDQAGNLLVTGPGDGNIKQWNVKSPETAQPTAPSTDDKTVSKSPDQQYVASTTEENTILVQTTQGEEVHELRGHIDEISAVEFIDNYTLATGSKDETVRLWDVETGELLHTLRGHSDTIIDITFCPDKQYLYTASLDDSVRKWPFAPEELLRIARGRLQGDPVGKD